MKRAIFTLLIGAAFTASFAQSSKAIVTNGYSAQIGDFNPTDLSFSNSQNLGYFQPGFKPTDFIFDSKNGHAVYQNSNKGLVYVTISGNNISERNLNMNQSSVMAPAFIPSSEKIVCFKVQREFNGYGSNEENLFFTSIDLKKGVSTNLIKFTDLSFDNVTAPYYGTVSIMDRFRVITEKEVALSKPLYVPEKDLYIVLVRDVTGTNRLYKMHVNNPGATVASTRCDFNIIDMAYVANSDIAKALFFEKSGSTYQLKVGDFNLTTNTMTNVANTGAPFTASRIDNGSIKFNTDQSQLYVSRYDGANTNIYTLNVENNQNNSSVAFPGYVQYDFGFNESYYKPLTYASVFGLYPNPSTGLVHFKNISGVKPNGIKVYDNVGQLIRSVKVEEASSNISFDLSEMAVGIYHVRVDMPGEDFIGKVAITH